MRAVPDGAAHLRPSEDARREECRSRASSTARRLRSRKERTDARNRHVQRRRRPDRNVPDPTIEEPTDAIIRVVRSCICGSDLWPYSSMAPSASGQSMGHEAIGVVEEIGADVRTLKRDDVVVMPFAISDGTCEFCHEGLQTACVHVGFFGNNGTNGAQAEALRIPYADGTLYPLPVGEDDALLPSLLTLSDVMGTGHHAAVVAKVAPGHKVAVVGDGAVGLCGVIAAKRLGAEQIIILGRHADRIVIAREFGATDVVGERGAEAVERVKELTGGHGAHSVLECVGLDQSVETAIEIARPGGAVGPVGVPQHEAIPGAEPSFYNNVTIGGGPAPVRAYIDDLLPDVLDGRIDPGRVFDRVVDLDGVPEGYRAMNDREAIKVMVNPS
ncbi:MAG TPA: zinc-dependent alcohol dehydrogenase family protein [Gaiellaceae bacterium]|nr:zinc-dependent alcohol dehydrogenase family protein [Gaiellaceae bacterium]